MASSQSRDPNGFLLVKACPISSFGLFDYSAGQLGLDGDPNRIVKVFRPEEAVSDPEAIESFKNVPLINDHEMLSGFNGDETASAPEDYGIDGVLTSNVYYEQPWMRGDLKVFSREMQEAISSGKKDLSLGYSCEFEVAPGVFEGQPYEVVQTKMRGNHIALVDKGRVPGARVLDGRMFDHLRFDVQSSKKGSTMKLKSKKAMDNAVAQLKALLPALEQYLKEEATEPAHQDGNEAEAAGSEGAGAGEAAGASVPAEGGADPAASVEGGEGGGEGSGGDLASLISEVEAVLSKLKAAAGGQGIDEEAGIHEGERGTDEEVESAIREGGESSVKLDGKDEEEPGAVAADFENTDNEEPAETKGGQGKVSAGPSAGTHSKAGDSALQRFYADFAAKGRLYDRLSAVVGAFDHAAMDARAVARYGVKKLGIACDAGQETVALDAYLAGHEKVRKDTKVRVQQTRAADSAVASTAELDAYLNGAK